MCVKVTGPPRRICSVKYGTTDPLDPSTLPNRTILKRVWRFGIPRSFESASSERASESESACKHFSANRLLAPITLVGRTALSVEISTNDATPHLRAACAARNVPRTLTLTPSISFASTIGTCLYAAA